MKRLFFTSLTITLIFTAFSCKDEKQPDNTVTNTVVVKKDSLANSTTNKIVISKTEQLTQAIIAETKKTKEILTNSNSVALYKTFKEKIEGLVGEISTDNSFLIDHYNDFFNAKTNEMVYPDSIKTKINYFDTANLEIQDIGEGMVEIHTKADFYNAIFNKYLPADYAAYLQLEAFDNSTLYEDDAGFAISLTEVSQRVLNWEKYLVKFPNSPLYEDARTKYKYYLRDYLYGLDNTSNFEYGETTLNAESKKEFDRYINKNPNTVSAKIVKAMMTCLERKVTPEELDAVVKQEQARYALTL